MTANKQIRKVISGLREQVAAHQRKIELELGKSAPDEGLVRHWEQEIRGWLRQIERKEQRLP